MKPKVLSAMQQAFVAEYLVDLNATAAAKRAGYSARTATKIGSELLAKPLIAAAIAQAMEARARRTEITQDRVLIELARVAFFDPRKLLNADGSPKEIHELDDDTAGAIAGVSLYQDYIGYGDGRRAIGQTKKIKVADKVAALGLSMRHLGMLRDKLIVSNPDGSSLVPRKKTDLTDDELLAIAAAAPRSRG